MDRIIRVETNFDNSVQEFYHWNFIDVLNEVEKRAKEKGKKRSDFIITNKTT